MFLLNTFNFGWDKWLPITPERKSEIQASGRLDSICIFVSYLYFNSTNRDIRTYQLLDWFSSFRKSSFPEKHDVLSILSLVRESVQDFFSSLQFQIVSKVWAISQVLWDIKFPVCFHVQESHLLWVDSRDDSAQCGDEPGADLGIVAACQESMGQITNVLSVAQSTQKTVHTLLSG